MCDKTLQNACQNDKTNPSKDRGGSVKQAALQAWSMPTQPKARPSHHSKSPRSSHQALPERTSSCNALAKRWCASVIVSRPTAKPGAPPSNWCWSRCPSAFVPTNWWAFRLAMAKKRCNHRSRQPVASGTLRFACGDCHGAQPAYWDYLTAYGRYRNEIDVESIFIQKSCIYPDLDICRFELCGLNQS